MRVGGSWSASGWSTCNVTEKNNTALIIPVYSFDTTSNLTEVFLISRLKVSLYDRAEASFPDCQMERFDYCASISKQTSKILTKLQQPQQSLETHKFNFIYVVGAVT